MAENLTLAQRLRTMAAISPGEELRLDIDDTMAEALAIWIESALAIDQSPEARAQMQAAIGAEDPEKIIEAGDFVLMTISRYRASAPDGTMAWRLWAAAIANPDSRFLFKLDREQARDLALRLEQSEALNEMLESVRFLRKEIAAKREAASVEKPDGFTRRDFGDLAIYLCYALFVAGWIQLIVWLVEWARG